MRRFVVPTVLSLTLPGLSLALSGLAAAQTTGAATGANPAGPPLTYQTAPVTPGANANPSTNPGTDQDAGPANGSPGTAMPGKHAAMMQKWQQRFTAANTSHDGHLTLPQAQAANLRPVVANFGAIDTQHRGYVTFNDIQAWRMDRLAQKLQQRAAALRAQD